MVAGRVKAAMGFQWSPATPRPSSSSSARKAAAPAPLQLPGSAASGAGQPETPRRRSSGSPAPSGSGSKAGPFSRYFPRSSAQVQPARAASEPAELVRLVEELQERESRLRTELLEHKILKETVAIVPFLEAELAAKSSELGRCRDALSRLEAENARLRAELDAAVAAARSNEQRVLEMEKELAEVRKRRREADDCSSSASSDNSERSNAATKSVMPAKVVAGLSVLLLWLVARLAGELLIQFLLVRAINADLLFRHRGVKKPRTGAIQAPADTRPTPASTAAATTVNVDARTPQCQLVTVDLKQQQQRRRGTSGSTATTSTCGEEDLQSVLPCDFGVDSGARSMREASPRGGGVLPLADAERLEVEGCRRNR
ncbi:hypothetical protein C2845_PM05G28610 [Panicum miliaceum]|uniref:Uncharacterized protein n=1 Tax=Panicum miliaceum TaxID=4540 RepID=A0A3L6T2Q3_PANMI|nr:hypothetical protein C2845_PM05G28610 [Panicum miliaceum]